MLKKAGIVVATVATGLLAVSPLAFAGSEDGGNHHDGDKQVNVNEGDSSNGLINVTGNNVGFPIQACNNDVPVNVTGVGGQVPIQDNDLIAPITGALAFFGVVDQDVDQDIDVDRSRNCEQASSTGDTNSQSNS